MRNLKIKGNSGYLNPILSVGDSTWNSDSNNPYLKYLDKSIQQGIDSHNTAYNNGDIAVDSNGVPINVNLPEVTATAPARDVKYAGTTIPKEVVRNNDLFNQTKKSLDYQRQGSAEWAKGIGQLGLVLNPWSIIPATAAAYTNKASEYVIDGGIDNTLGGYGVLLNPGNFVGPGLGRSGLKLVGQGMKALSKEGIKEGVKSRTNNAFQKARLGYVDTDLDGMTFIRNTGVVPEVKNGKVWLSPEGNNFINMTYDRPFTLHSKYKHRPGEVFMTIDGKAFNAKDAISIKPSDTIFPNNQIDPKYITIYSGNSDILNQAQNLGYKTRTNDVLKSFSQQMKEGRDTPSSIGSGVSLEKEDVSFPKGYTKGIIDLIRQDYPTSMRNVKDLEYKTGLKADVYRNNFINRLIRDVKNKKIRESPYYDRLLYNPASSIESDLSKKYNFPVHPSFQNIDYQSIANQERLANRDIIQNALNSKGIKSLGVLSQNIKRNLDLYRNLEGGWYSGVPGNPLRDNPSKTMAEAFPDYKGTIWTANKADYARQYSVGTGNVHPDGQVYQVFFDPRKLNLAEAPKPPSSKNGFNWTALPFRFKGNKIVDKIDRHSLGSIHNPYNGPLSIIDGVSLKHLNSHGRLPFPRVTTDTIVNQSKTKGFDGVRFYNINDGALYPKKAYTFDKYGPTVDYDVVNKASADGKNFVDEVVLNPNAEHYVLKEGEPKWHLLKQFNWLRE